MKPTAAKPIYDAAGGRVLPDGSRVDFVLFLPGDHYEIVDDDEFEEAARDDRLAIEDTSIVQLLHPVSWLELEREAEDLEELETVPEPRLDDDVTHVNRQPRERTWWEAARRGLRIRPER